MLNALCTDILAKLPPNFDVEAVQRMYPVMYSESMNTVLTQELVRFNRLLSEIHGSLKSLIKALKGEMVMTEQLDTTARAMYDGRVPESWKKKSYPSLKPLASYIQDLLKRLAMLQDWIDTGVPEIFWLPGFYFTHAFLTGVRQNYARKYNYSIDSIDLDFEFFAEKPEQKPEDGAIVHGLYLEGCRWDIEAGELTESLPKIPHAELCIVFLKPCVDTKLSDYDHYECPVYKTSERRGTLATTGHSTNFVLMIRLPSSKPWQHWVKRGVALLCQLND